jgi:tetratricopeptide (TPR) repeat protein
MRTRCILLFVLLAACLHAQDPLAHQRLSKNDVLDGLKNGMTPSRVATLADEYGLDFDPTAAADEIRTAGGDDALVQSLRKTADLQVYKLVTAARLFLDNLDLDRATEEFNAALKLDARSLDAQLGLGDAALYGGKLDDALAAYQLAAKAHPDAALAQVKIGKIYEGTGKVDEAQKAYSAAIMLEPANADATAGYERTRIKKEFATTKVFPRAVASLGVIVSENDVLRRFCKRKEGVVVAGLLPKGPAARAGLRACDQILLVEGMPVTSINDVRLMSTAKADQPLRLLVLQGPVRRFLTVTTDTLQAVYGDFADANARYAQVHGVSTDVGLGLMAADMTDEWAAALGVRKEGVLVFNAVKDSVAFKLGLRPRLIILSINSQAIANKEQLRQRLSELKSGQDVVILFREVFGGTNTGEYYAGAVMP